MRNKILVSLLIGGSVFLTVPAQAQTSTLGTVFEKSPDSGKKRLAGPSASQLQSGDSTGFVSFQSLAVEFGHNDNVDQFFGNGNESPYGRVDGNLLLGYISGSGATTFAVKGQLYQFDEDIKNTSRWDIGAALDNDYAISDRMRVGFGGYYLRDEVNVVPTDEAGAYTSLAYADSFMDANLVGRVDDIQYVGAYPFPALVPVSATALVRPGEFSHLRTEGVGNYIMMKERSVAFYGEVGGADINYTDQKIPGTIDRDAREYWSFSGVRWTPDPSIILDLGYRYNRRNFEDARLSHFDSSFFDGKIIWTPGSNLLLQFEVDRKITTPVSVAALATDQKTYSFSAAFRPAENVSITPFVRIRELDQIGDTTSYDERVFGVGSEMQLSGGITVYGHLQNKNLKETTSGSVMDQTKGGVGVKISF